MAMKLIKKTAEYKIFMRGDDRYAVQDANGKPVLGKDGKPLIARRLTFDKHDPRIPPGGSIGPNGQILDANGNPVFDGFGDFVPLAAAGEAVSGTSLTAISCQWPSALIPRPPLSFPRLQTDCA